MLFDSQENIFRKISSVFSQSSHSTNVGDLEETLLRAMDPENNTTNMDESPSTYVLRTHTIAKGQKRKRRKKRGRPTKSPKSSSTGEEFPAANSADMEHFSQESVSMLRDCYEEKDFPDLMETSLNAEVIDIYSEEVEVPVEDAQVESSVPIKVESSTQTDLFLSQPDLNHPKETEMAKHAKFIGAVVKLKAVLSSKKTVSEKKLSLILRGAESDDEIPSGMEIDSPNLPKETIGYLLRSSDVENVFRATVQVLLQHLEDSIRKDFVKVACCWKNSVYEMVVEMLSQAVESEAGVWKMIASFLCKIIASILNDKSKTWTKESKTNFIMSFCQSTRLSYSLANYIVKQLEKLKSIERSNSSTRNISSVLLTNNSYFLLRILEACLEFLKHRIAEEKIEGVLVKKPQGKNYNVLEMWKRHWKMNEIPEEEKTGHEWEMTVSGWSKALDEILLHCVNHIPVLSMAVERCVELAKEMVKLCHAGMLEGKDSFAPL